MTLEELEAVLTAIRDGHDDQALVTEQLQAIREGFSTTQATLEETTATLTEAQEKYLGALEVNGRLHNQLGFQRPKDEENKEKDEPKILSVDELFIVDDY